MKGKIQFTGRKPPKREIDMDQDPECARMHKSGHVSDESVVVNPNGTLANVFIYVKSGLEGKTFEPPAAAGDNRPEWMLVQAARSSGYKPARH